MYTKKLEKSLISEKNKQVEAILKKSEEIDNIKSTMGTAHFSEQFL